MLFLYIWGIFQLEIDLRSSSRGTGAGYNYWGSGRSQDIGPTKQTGNVKASD